MAGSGIRDNRASVNLCSSFHLTQWEMIETGVAKVNVYT